VGKPLVIKRARPRITTVSSSLAAVTRDQILQRKEVEGSFNEERFLNFLKDLSLPPGTRRMTVPGGKKLLDNVSFHHSLVVKDLPAQPLSV
jgi:hypothetical protein